MRVSARRHGEKPPRQDRSRRTLASLLDAAERLLQGRAWEHIAIADIVREAGVSSGAVYGRFAGKDELLVALYERHDARLKARTRDRRGHGPRKGDTLELFLQREIADLVRYYTRNRWLLRAMGLLARTRPEVVTSSMREERRALLAELRGRVLTFRDEITAEDPERSVELVIFYVATILRECLLYPGPHADSLDTDVRELASSLQHMALRVLGVSPRTTAGGARSRRKA